MATRKTLKGKATIFGRTGKVVAIAIVSTAIVTIYANIQKGKEWVQCNIVKPVVIQQFEKLHEPYKLNQDSMIWNQKVTIEMLELALGDSSGRLKSKAIDNVENPPGTIRRGRARRGE